MASEHFFDDVSISQTESARAGHDLPAVIAEIPRAVDIQDTVRAAWKITDLNLPRKSATLRTRCMVKEDVVIDGEAIVLVPTRA